jgi:hypothetical protein
VTDTLRDRIAAVQKAHIFCLVECSCGYQIDSIHPSSPDWKTDAECDWADHVADAVIAQLGLRCEVDDKAAFRMEPSRHRWVTEWREANE